MKVWGSIVASERVRSGGGYTRLTLLAYGPGYVTETLAVEVRPPAEMLRGECYYIYAIVDGTGRTPLLRGYQSERIPPDTRGICN